MFNNKSGGILLATHAEGCHARRGITAGTRGSIRVRARLNFGGSPHYYGLYLGFFGSALLILCCANRCEYRCRRRLDPDRSHARRRCQFDFREGFGSGSGRPELTGDVQPDAEAVVTATPEQLAETGSRSVGGFGVYGRGAFADRRRAGDELDCLATAFISNRRANRSRDS